MLKQIGVNYFQCKGTFPLNTDGHEWKVWRREFWQMRGEHRRACERSRRREQRQMALKVLTAPPAICVSVCVSPLPKPQTAFCPCRYTGGDMQQLTEGHDTGVCLGRRQECSDPGGGDASQTRAPLISPVLCLHLHRQAS